MSWRDRGDRDRAGCRFLAPKFGGARRTGPRPSSWCAYSLTAGWVAGILGLIPSLSPCSECLPALYGLYLFYLGATPVMKVPEDKAVGYTAVTVRGRDSGQ